MFRKVVLASVLLPLVALAVYLFLPTWRAHRLLSQVSSLEVGKSTFADAEKLAGSLHAQATAYCTATECNWYSRTDNSSLPRFWRGEGAAFTVGFRVQNGVVTERGVLYRVGSGFAASPYADIEERTSWPDGPPPNPVSVQTQWTAHTPHYSVLVLMVPTVPAETRSKYLGFDFGCMWHYGGCSDAQQLLPAAEWKD
jgi:hypothetical protein